MLTVVLAGCGKKAAPAEPVVTGVPETGLVIDLSRRNGEEITATPGDVLYLELSGVGGSGKQWTVVSPTSSSCLVLKDQQVSGLAEANASSSFKWWLKVEEACRVQLGFDYGKLPKGGERSFGVTIVSQ